MRKSLLRHLAVRVHRSTWRPSHHGGTACRAPFQLVEGLSRMHLELSQRLAHAAGPGIPVVVFLQPALPLKSERTFTEDVRLATAERRQPGISALTRAVMPVLAALDGNPVAVHDLSGLFDAEPETRFQDFVHLLPEGNALVARSITGVLQRDPASWCVAMNPGS